MKDVFLQPGVDSGFFFTRKVDPFNFCFYFLHERRAER